MERRILFVSATLGVGGGERQWAVLIPELRQRGLEPTVLTLYQGGFFSNELARRGVATESAGMRSRFDVGGLVDVMARRRTMDLVVSQSFAGQLVGHAIAGRAGVPHLTTEHQPPGLPRRRRERVFLPALSPHVGAVVAVSPSQIPDLLELGYRQSRIRVIPNGVGSLDAGRRPEQVRAELGAPDGAFVAVLAAALRMQKQVHVFVEAVARANAVDDRVVGLIAGTGPERDRIEALARATGGVVRLLGERSDVVDILAAADTACLSSNWEGLPMVVLEAMALGKPVVATDVGGTRDAVVHEETGLLVPPADPAAMAEALLRLARAPDLATRLGAGAKERQSALFSSERMVDDYARLFESFAARPSPARA
jgi:glycosyltransferase involved in cell wall biosynthesis